VRNIFGGNMVPLSALHTLQFLHIHGEQTEVWSD